MKIQIEGYSITLVYILNQIEIVETTMKWEYKVAYKIQGVTLRGKEWCGKMASSFQQQWFGEAQPHCVGMKEEGSAY
jgi:hypothetical protein